MARGNARVGVQSGLAEQQLMTLWVTPALGLTLFLIGVLEEHRMPSCAAAVRAGAPEHFGRPSG